MITTQLTSAKVSDGTFTDTNWLNSAMLTKPEILDLLIHTISRGYGAGGQGTFNLMQYLTQGMNGMVKGSEMKQYQVVGDTELRWGVHARLIETMPITSTATPFVSGQTGANFSLFKLGIGQKYFVLGDVCRFEDGNLARVVAEPFKDGNNWCYTFQIIGSNPSAFIADSALAVGARIAWNFTAFEEGSNDVGGSKTSTPMMFRQQMGIMRMSSGATGSAKNTVMVFKIKNHDKKTESNIWLTQQQYDYMLQWTRQMEVGLWSSLWNKLSDDTIPHIGTTGRPVQMFSGFEEQLSSSNYISANTLTEDMLRYMLIDISHQNGDMENMKKVIVSGHGGLDLFDRVLRNSAQQYQVVDTNFINKLTGNKLAFGSQFVTYRGLSGAEWTIVNHPMFNDETVFPQLAGPHGFTRQSYKMFFFDFGSLDGVPNIHLATLGANGEDRRFIQWFSGGSTVPNGVPDMANMSMGDIASNNRGVAKALRSHGGDYYQAYTLSQVAPIVRYPLQCGVIDINPTF